MLKWKSLYWMSGMQDGAFCADTPLALARTALPPLTKFYLKSLLGRCIEIGIPLNPQAQWCNYIINQIN